MSAPICMSLQQHSAPTSMFCQHSTHGCNHVVKVGWDHFHPLFFPFPLFLVSPPSPSTFLLRQLLFHSRNLGDYYKHLPRVQMEPGRQTHFDTFRQKKTRFVALVFMNELFSKNKFWILTFRFSWQWFPKVLTYQYTPLVPESQNFGGAPLDGPHVSCCFHPVQRFPPHELTYPHASSHFPTDQDSSAPYYNRCYCATIDFTLYVHFMLFILYLVLTRGFILLFIVVHSLLVCVSQCPVCVWLHDDVSVVIMLTVSIDNRRSRHAEYCEY